MATKTIWMINQYGSTPEYGIGGRHYYFARELARRGHKVYLIAASFTHILRQPPELTGSYLVERQTEQQNFSMVWLKVPRYKSARSKKRILNWFLFAWQLLRLKHIIKDTPDAILYSSPSLLPCIAAERLARYYQCRLIFEVRDIWPLTFMEVGGYSARHPFIRFLQYIEDRAYRNADCIVSNLKYAAAHIETRSKQKKPFTWIPNGISLTEMGAGAGTTHYDELKSEHSFIVGYTGTVGLANALHTLIDAAQLLRQHRNIRFLIVGSGQEKQSLMERVRAEQLENVTFMDPVAKSNIQNVLAIFDVCYIGLRKDPLFRFGVSPNKLFDYFYAARPVLYAIDSGDYRPVAAAGAGIEIEPEDAQALAHAIQTLYTMSPQQRQAMGNNGRKTVLEQYEYSQLTEKLLQVVCGSFDQPATTPEENP